MIHVAVAVGTVIVASALLLFGLPLYVIWIIAGLNVVAWPAREILQALDRYGELVLPGSPKWSRQKTREALYPMIAAPVAALVITILVWGTWHG